jgi:hypothetical protein
MEGGQLEGGQLAGQLLVNKPTMVSPFETTFDHFDAWALGGIGSYQSMLQGK